MYLLVLTRVTDLILKDSEGSSKEEKNIWVKLFLSKLLDVLVQHTTLFSSNHNHILIL